MCRKTFLKLYMHLTITGKGDRFELDLKQSNCLCDLRGGMRTPCNFVTAQKSDVSRVAATILCIEVSESLRLLIRQWKECITHRNTALWCALKLKRQHSPSGTFICSFFLNLKAPIIFILAALNFRPIISMTRRPTLKGPTDFPYCMRFSGLDLI